jgi:L-fuconate dehydratase
MQRLAAFRPRWIEEPIHCDDILGHLKVQQALPGIQVAGGEQTANRVLMKQFLSSGAYTVCQQDAVKCGGLNEWLTSALLAAKHGVPMCPHTGGVALCQMGPHLGAIDFTVISKSFDGRVTEYGRERARSSAS